MAASWTLETGGHEKTLAEWGICADFSLTIQNKLGGIMALRTIEDFDGAPPQFAYLQPGIVRRDRELDDGGIYIPDSGAIYFQGYFDDLTRLSSGGRQNIEYRLNSVWWLLKLLQYKQLTNEFAGFDTTKQRVANFSVLAGGSGYNKGEVLTVVGGAGAPAQATIVAVDAAGAVTYVLPSNSGGAYTQAPPTPNTAAGGSGNGCKLTLLFGPVVKTVPKVSSEVFLGEALDSPNNYAFHQTNGQQIAEILQFANRCYNSTKRESPTGDDSLDVLKIGTIDPSLFLPITNQNTVHCDEAIMTCLNWTTDAMIVEEVSKTPPIIHVRQMAKWNNATNPPTFIDYSNLPEVVINITLEQESEIILRSELGRQVDGVIIYYRWFDIGDGVQYPKLVVDKYPPGISDFLPFVSSHTIDLAGSSNNHVISRVAGTVFPLSAGASLATMKAWWIAHDNSLSSALDPLIDPASIEPTGTATVVDDNGNPIDTTLYHYELTDKLEDWVGGAWVRARVSQQIKFQRYTDESHKILEHESGGRLHTKTIILMTVAPGQKVGFSGTTGEGIPQNVAESVFRSAAAPMYSGRLVLTDEQLRAAMGNVPMNMLGFKVKAIGPNTTFTNLFVQKIEDRPHMGITVLEFAPVSPVDLDQWVQLSRASRLRTVYNMPSGRGDGGISA